MKTLSELRNSYKPRSIHYTHGVEQASSETPMFIDMTFRTKSAADAALESIGPDAMYHQELEGHVITLLNG